MPKGPSTTQYIVGIVADQHSKMAATIIGSKPPLFQSGAINHQRTYLFVKRNLYKTYILQEDY